MKGFCGLSRVSVGLLCLLVPVCTVNGQVVAQIDFSAAQGYSDGPLLGQPAGAADTWQEGLPGTPVGDTAAIANEALVAAPDGGDSRWTYITFPVQTSGKLIVTWDWQYVGPADGVLDVGFCISDTDNFNLDGNPALTWNEQGAMTRMSGSAIDVRSGDLEGGGGYEALQPYPYADGQLVSMRFEINLDTQTYDCYAQKPGEAEVLLADDYQFRRGVQTGLNAISMWIGGDTAGMSVNLDNIVISKAPPGVAQIDFSAAQGYSDGPLLGQPAGAADTWANGTAGTPPDSFVVSNEALVITPEGIDRWTYITFPVQASGKLIVTWDWQYVGPADSTVDIGFNISDTENFNLDGNPDLTWNEQGAMCRMEQGNALIDVRNGDLAGGGGYEKLQDLGYTDGKLVSMRYEIDIDNQSYDCYAQKEGEAEVLLADDYLFRRGISTGLNAIALWDDGDATTSSVIVDNIVISTAGAPLGIFEATVDIDDGNIGPGTAATYDAATDTYTVTGSGADVWGEVDGMRYVYREWSGDFCITADVSLEAGIDEWSKAMLMARQDLSPGSVNISTRMRPEDGQYSTQWRTTADGSSSSTDSSLRVVGLNPGTHRLIRSGNTFYTSCVMDSAWVLIDVNECVMTDPILLGIGVTAHSANALCTGIFSNVTITPMAVTSHAEGYQYYK